MTTTYPIRLAIFALPFFAGCAAQPESPPQDFAYKLKPGRVAVVPARYAPADISTREALGKGAAASLRAGELAGEGAALGALAPLHAALRMPLILPAVPLLIPVGALIGAVTGGTVGAAKGAWGGMPAEHADAIRQPVQRALKQTSLQDGFAAHFMAAAADRPHYAFVQLREGGPASPADAPSYPRLKQDFDSVLELGVSGVGFSAWREDGQVPRARFELTMRARNLRLDGSTRPATRELLYSGEWRPIPAWAADGERLLEQELEAARGDFSQRIIEAALWPAQGD